MLLHLRRAIKVSIISAAKNYIATREPLPSKNKTNRKNLNILELCSSKIRNKYYERSESKFKIFDNNARVNLRGDAKKKDKTHLKLKA